eukprot:Pgem_evm1s19989
MDVGSASITQTQESHSVSATQSQESMVDESVIAGPSSSSVITDLDSSAAFLEQNLKVLLEDIDAQITANKSQLVEVTSATDRIAIERYLLELKTKRLELVTDFRTKKESESKTSALNIPIKKKVKILPGGVKTLADKCLLMYHARNYVERHCQDDRQHKAVLLEHFENNKCFDDAQCIQSIDDDIANIDQLISMVYQHHNRARTSFLFQGLCQKLFAGRHGQSSAKMVKELVDLFNMYNVIIHGDYLMKTEQARKERMECDLELLITVFNTIVSTHTKTMMVDEIAGLLNPSYGEGVTYLADKRLFILQKMEHLACSDDELHKATTSKGSKRTTSDRHETDDQESSHKGKNKRKKSSENPKQQEGTLKKPCSECGKKAEDRHHKKWDCKRQTDAEFRRSSIWNDRKNGKTNKALLDTGANISVIDKTILSKMKGIYYDKRDIQLSLAGKGVVGRAYGQLTDPVMLSIGRGRVTKSRPLVMDLQRDEYDMILSLQDMYELGMVIAGLPNPTDIDNDSSLQDDDLLN